MFCAIFISFLKLKYNLMKLYRILTVLINCFLIFGIFISVYEDLDGGYADIDDSMYASLFFLYFIFSTSYFVWKTRKVSKQDAASIDTSNSNFENLFEVEHFKHENFISVSNIVLGSLIILSGISILVFYPINLRLSGEQLRLGTVVFLIFYGWLKIDYSVFIIKRIKKRS